MYEAQIVWSINTEPIAALKGVEVSNGNLVIYLNFH